MKIVVLDSLSGYQHAMPQDAYLILQMHELLTYLNQQGIVTILVLAQHGLVGNMQSPVDLTYLSDTVLLLRFFEARGELNRAISVVKKRTGSHQGAIREFRIDRHGIAVGEPLRNFSGVMTGVPSFIEQNEHLPDAQQASEKASARVSKRWVIVSALLLHLAATQRFSNRFSKVRRSRARHLPIFRRFSKLSSMAGSVQSSSQRKGSPTTTLWLWRLGLPHSHLGRTFRLSS